MLRVTEWGRLPPNQRASEMRPEDEEDDDEEGGDDDEEGGDDDEV